MYSVGCMGEAVKVCMSRKDIKRGKAIHAIILKCPILSTSTYLANNIIIFYTKVSLIPLAISTFYYIPSPNIFSFNVVMAALSAVPSAVLRLFHLIPAPDIVSYNTLLSTLSPSAALSLLSSMLSSTIRPDHFSFSSAISGSPSVSVRPLHGIAISSGHGHFPSVSNSLISAYSRLGDLATAEMVFTKAEQRDPVTWKAIMAAYTLHREPTKALRVYTAGEGGPGTEASVLAAFTGMGDLRGGKQLHGRVVKFGLEGNVRVASGLVDMYNKCGGGLEEAKMVFREVAEGGRDRVLWNTMVYCYGKDGGGRKMEVATVECFRGMQRAGHQPDDGSFVAVVGACAAAGSRCHGCQVHALALKSKLDPGGRVAVSNALLSFYSKSGSLHDAIKLFHSMPVRDMVTMNAMIGGYAQHGQGSECLSLFEEMLESGMRPNGITFISVLTACAHTGRVEEGRGYFEMMEKRFGIEPGPEHISCMIDLLARAGKLGEAKWVALLNSGGGGVVGWGALLGACRVHRETLMGEEAARRLIEEDGNNASPYVVLCHMYREAGRWGDVAAVRKVMRERGVRKEAGLSWVEVGNRAHVFVADESSHPSIRQIRQCLDEMEQLRSPQHHNICSWPDFF